MNEIDIRTCLEETKAQAMTFVDREGKRKRRTAKEAALVTAVRVITKAPSFTVDWPGRKECPFGYDTIYEHMAGEYLSEGPKQQEKAEAVIEFTSLVQTGFAALRDKLMEQWNLPIYFVPRSASGLLIEVITLDPEYVVNAAGEVAAEIAEKRDNNAVRGQIAASYKRQALTVGYERAREALSHITESVIGSELPPPKGTAALRQVPRLSGGAVLGNTQ